MDEDYVDAPQTGECGAGSSSSIITSRLDDGGGGLESRQRPSSNLNRQGWSNAIDRLLDNSHSFRIDGQETVKTEGYGEDRGRFEIVVTSLWRVTVILFGQLQGIGPCGLTLKCSGEAVGEGTTEQLAQQSALCLAEEEAKVNGIARFLETGETGFEESASLVWRKDELDEVDKLASLARSIYSYTTTFHPTKQSWIMDESTAGGMLEDLLGAASSGQSAANGRDVGMKVWR